MMNERVSEWMNEWINKLIKFMKSCTSAHSCVGKTHKSEKIPKT